MQQKKKLVLSLVKQNTRLHLSSHYNDDES